MEILWILYEGCTIDGVKMPDGQERAMIFAGSSVIIGKSPYLGSLYKTNGLDTSPWWADNDLQQAAGGPFTFTGSFEGAFSELQKLF